MHRVFHRPPSQIACICVNALLLFHHSEFLILILLSRSWSLTKFHHIHTRLERAVNATLLACRYIGDLLISFGAPNRTRTYKTFQSSGPQPDAFTNFAISAYKIFLNGAGNRDRTCKPFGAGS